MGRRRDDAALWENEELYLEEEIPDLEDAITQETARQFSRQARRQARKKEQEAYRLGYEEGLRESRRREDAYRPGRRQKKKRGGCVLWLIVLILIIPVILYVLSTIPARTGMGGLDVAQSISETAKNDPAAAHFTTIAIFGLDARDQNLDEGDNRSDVIMVAAVNERTGEIALASVYRDTYLKVAEDTYAKANAAFAYGGTRGAVAMLNENFDLAITDCAAVGFEGLVTLVDAVGGVQITVEEDEVEHLNNYASTMAQELGRSFVPVPGSGFQLLNGLQAAAYCRIRYTAGDDFRRTARQREVLSQVAKRAKENPFGLIRSMPRLLEVVNTSISPKDLAKLLLVLPRMKLVDSTGFPGENMRGFATIREQSCVIPVTLSDTVRAMHSYLYGDSAYVPSERVESISAHIREVSGL